MSNYNFDGTDDVFDSRDVIERIAELEEIGTETNSEGTGFDPDRLCDEFREEYDALIAFRDEAEQEFSEWTDGVTFVLDDYFTDYAMDMLEDVGYLPADLPEWIVIDRDETADNVREDYTSIEFRGETYWARA